MSESQGLPTILIVDDEPINVEILMECLDEGTYNLEAAYDGLEAWEKLEANPSHYDVILLDRMMPKMNGMETLSRIKAHAELKDRPVILHTSLDAKEEILEGLQAGAYYYLTKPFEEQMLQSVVATAVGDRQRYKKAVEESSLADRTISLMQEGVFRFQTTHAARDLAKVLSNACPEPGRAVIGLLELLINGVEHGNLGISYDEKSRLRAIGAWDEEVEKRLADPANQDKFVEISYRREQEGVRLMIKDQGRGFDWASYMELDPARIFDNHGRGIAISRAVSFDEVKYHGCGNEVEVFAGVKKRNN